MAHRVGQSIESYIMNANDEVIARSTVSLLETSGYNIFDTKHQIRNLDEIITKSIVKNYRNATNA